MPDLYAQLHNRQLEATNLSAKWPFKKQTKRNNQKHPNTPPPQYAIAHHSGFAKILSINKSRDTLMLYW